MSGSEAEADTATAAGGTADLRAGVRFLRRRAGWIAAGTALGLGAAAAVLALLPVRYTASATLMLDPRAPQVVPADAVLPGLSGDQATIDGEVEVLRSRMLAEAVAARVDVPPAGPGARARAAAVLDRLLGFGPLPSAPAATGADAAEVVQAGLDVRREGLTRVIRVAFTHSDPVAAADIANTVAGTYVAAQEEAKTAATQAANAVLAERVAALRADVEAAERAITRFRTENGLSGTAGEAITEQQISELNARLVLARAETAEQAAKYRQVARLLDTGGAADTVADVLASPVIAQLRQQEAAIAREEAELATRYGDRHPRLLKVRAERADLAERIRDEAGRIVANLRNELAVAQSREASLARSLEALSVREGENDAAAVGLRELERKAEAARQMYGAVLARFLETREAAGTERADARILSPAAVPTRPTGPPVPLVLALGGLFGLLAGTGAGAAADRLVAGFRTAVEAERVLGMPCLGGIPELRARDRRVGGKALSPADYLVARPLSGYAEAVRGLRTAVAFSARGGAGGVKVIAVTSSLPEEGKTTLSVSLARSAALAGLGTLLIDADLRHPRVAAALGAEPQAGLGDYLSGRTALLDALFTDTATGLRVLPVAGGMETTPDVLGTEAMTRLMAACRQTFDLVIIDTPPILPVVDARLVAAHADAMVFAVRALATPRATVRQALARLGPEAPVAGLALTRVDVRAQALHGETDTGYGYPPYTRYYDG
ncbi:GumC family protein [Futiania mangrovi]|uniref:non-specific protein-tyrosine kinase n=1 Tax=Futiania mangrovi TaxID=2959716 RepID=A0A9J6PCJ4_9PROT|nr:polysaccharide biosynthesis tyrosine autokinase [Futiania mangrovii]MCP1335355.1 polysaccharide biosynthesis tyrosine autokinase [Futiania mangrovii]